MKNLNVITQLFLFFQFLSGLLMLAFVKTDIQLGFAMVLLTQFVINWNILVQVNKK